MYIARIADVCRTSQNYHIKENVPGLLSCYLLTTAVDLFWCIRKLRKERFYSHDVQPQEGFTQGSGNGKMKRGDIGDPNNISSGPSGISSLTSLSMKQVDPLGWGGRAHSSLCLPFRMPACE